MKKSKITIEMSSADSVILMLLVPVSIVLFVKRDV
jgi:hypothetical protein